MDFLEMVRQDLEALLRDRNDTERKALLREFAVYRSDWESAQSLDERIKRARSFLAREMLGIAGGGEFAARLAAIEEKLDRVLALLEQVGTTFVTPQAKFPERSEGNAGETRRVSTKLAGNSPQAAESGRNAHDAAEEATSHEEEELFRGEDSECGELRHPERGSGQLSARAARVLRLLEEQGGASFKEVQNALSLSREEVLEAVSELFDKGKIRKEGIKYVPR